MSNEQKKKHMAHNIYSNPVLGKTSGKFEGFSIDFRGVQTPISTYWALCNWGMDVSSFKAEHPDAKGCGAYSGIQNTIEGRKAILSFWEILYENDTKCHRAKRMFPAGKESSFGGEGEGTNYITNFEWEDMTWYRMVLRSWRDSEKGTTFVGQWLENRASGEWNLMSYFDTGLVDSYMKGGMSQFQENFWDAHSEFIREFNIKNIHIKDLTDGEWKYIERTQLSYDDPKWGYNTAGTHTIGATSEYFFGSAGGDVEDQKKYDTERPLSSVYGIEKAEELILEQTSDIVLEGDTVKIIGSAHKVPVLSVLIETLDESGKTVESRLSTRPEITEFKVSGKSIKVTATDIYGTVSEKAFTL